MAMARLGSVTHSPAQLPELYFVYYLTPSSRGVNNLVHLVIVTRASTSAFGAVIGRQQLNHHAAPPLRGVQHLGDSATAPRLHGAPGMWPRRPRGRGGVAAVADPAEAGRDPSHKREQ
eukprot:354777-Chlamydomonas_euryale.AAC.7